MLPGEIIPRNKQGLHSRMMAQALGVAIGQTSEAPQTHADGQIEPLNVARAYPVFIAVAEHRQLFYVAYRGRRVAGGFLGAGVVLYQDGEVDLRLKRKRDIHPVGREAVGRQLKAAFADCALHLHQERPAS